MSFISRFPSNHEAPGAEPKTASPKPKLGDMLNGDAVVLYKVKEETIWYRVFWVPSDRSCRCASGPYDTFDFPVPHFDAVAIAQAVREAAAMEPKPDTILGNAKAVLFFKYIQDELDRRDKNERDEIDRLPA